MDIEDKFVLVTGACTEIGYRIAHDFAAKGAGLILVGRDQDKLDTIGEIFTYYGIISVIINADVTKDEDAKRIISETIAKRDKIDVLINIVDENQSTGIMDENAMENFDKIMAANLRSVVLMTHLAAKHLIATKGSIVNISSIMSTKPSSSFAYNCSKACLDHFTRCAALELAPYGVRVNCVNPRPDYTDLFEISEAVVLLAGAKGVTGSCFVVDNIT